ncbi:MAG: DUF4446 family protein [Anaerolineales bacterium]|nr:DUF4446 family protein [Anaerolineales bacterium]
MLQLWSDYGFYLWLLTTLLVVVALAWLAYSTFSGQSDDEAGPAADELGLPAGLEERLTGLAEAAPHMQATLGRTLQYVGLMRYADGSGAQAFSLAIFNARGDGFVLSSSAHGGLSAKPLTRWASNQPLSLEEQSAIEQARGGLEKA